MGSREAQGVNQTKALIGIALVYATFCNPFCRKSNLNDLFLLGLSGPRVVPGTILETRLGVVIWAPCAQRRPSGGLRIVLGDVLGSNRSFAWSTTQLAARASAPSSRTSPSSCGSRLARRAACARNSSRGRLDKGGQGGQEGRL